MIDSLVRRLVPVVPLVLLAAGCAADPGPSGAAQTPATTSATSSATPTTTVATISATTTATTTTTVAAPFAAADDRNFAACADGTCEVFVTTGDSLPNASGVGPVLIRVEGGAVTLSASSPDGFASSLSGFEGMPEQLNQQIFFIAAVQGDRAVLRLSPAP